MGEPRTNHYQRLHKTYSERNQKLSQTLNILAIVRFFTFAAGVYLGYILIKEDILLGAIIITLMLALFIYLVIIYLKKKEEQLLVKSLVRINISEIEALRGNISNFDEGEEFKKSSHNYANDLEIFGNLSLFQYLNRTYTYTGKNSLANWLSNPLKTKENIIGRQSSVTELSGLLHWRQLFSATANKLNIDQYQDTQLILWGKEQPNLSKSIFYKVIRWILPVTTFILLGLTINGSLPIGYFMLMLLINFFVVRKVSSTINHQHQKITRQIPALKNYSKLLKHIEKQSFSAQNLNDLKKNLFVEKHPSSSIIQKLSRISDDMDAGSHPIMSILLNLLFLWNIHQVIRIEKWHRLYAKHIEKWIETIGYMESLISLANFHYNNPVFTYPVISDSKILAADQMGHPLIHQKKRVTNDFNITKPGDTFIITGANMAGKSTFLRTIGINLVLAMNGAPVCAEKLEFKITNLFTNMNITDSLSKNESYFYAEIKRLKQLVDQAANRQDILVLLDEILTGTNTHDKEKASKAFLERLINMQATSIIATHDLSLTTLKEKHPDKIYNKSFEVELAGDHMNYDYRIRDGVAQNMNALELLRQMKLI